MNQIQEGAAPTLAAEHPCARQSLTMSFGDGADDNQPVPRKLTFAELIEEFSKPDLSRGTLPSTAYHALDKNVPSEKKVRDKEKNGRYFIACAFAGDGRRRNPNVRTLCGFTLDFDSGQTTKQIIKSKLGGIAYLAYSSYSWSAKMEKWRVFVPYVQPADVRDHTAIFDHFQKLFDGDVDPHCAVPSQLWYTPSCPPDAGNQFQSFHEFGELFDPSVFQHKAAPGEARDLDSDVPSGCPTNSDERIESLNSALGVISADERKIWVDFGIAIKHDLGEAGLRSWLAWSAKSSKFELDEALRAWESFKDDTSGPKITLGSIFYMARERGWGGDLGTIVVPEYVARLNQCYFLAPQGGKTLIFKEGTNPLDGQRTLQGMALRDFRALFTADMVDVPGGPGKIKRISVADAWLQHPAHRQYEGLILAPNREVPGYYNLWRGFAVEPQAGVWTLLREHIRVVLCKGDDTVFTYLLDWMAFCVQQPDSQGEVAIVMRGGRGTGKGIFARAFGSLFGQYFKHISQAKHLTGNFNAHLSDCIVLFVDEAFWAGDKQGEAVLKHVITEPTLTIERKGQDAEKVRNMLHILMASNNQWIVPAGVDERRFLVLDVDAAKQQDGAYFLALSEELENGGRAAMLQDLLQRNIEHFDHRQVPKTDALIEQKLLSLDPLHQWFFDRLQCGTLTCFEGEWELVLKERVLDSYVTCMKNAGNNRRALQTELGIRLRSLLPAPFPQSVKKTTPLGAIPGTAPHYRFPPLAVCRKHFEVLVGLQGYDWRGGAATE